MARSNDSTHVLIAGGLTSVWAVGPGFLSSVFAPKPRARLVAARPLGDGVALLDENGELLVGMGRRSCSIQTGITRPFGLLICENKHMIVHGSEGWGIYCFGESSLRQITFRRTMWAVHAGAPIPGDAAWLGGAFGRRIKIVSISGKPRWRSYPPLSHNINTISAMQDEHALFGGDEGYLAKVRSSTGVVTASFARGAKVTTMARRRQSLAGTINDDDRILRFLSQPESIDPQIVAILEDKIEQNRVLFADAAPSLPIVAAGTNEGIVELIDARDNQTFQIIDLEGGVGAELQGLIFLNDFTFATLSKKGVVRFHVSQYIIKDYRGPFLISEEEDKKLISSGLD